MWNKYTINAMSYMGVNLDPMFNMNKSCSCFRCERYRNQDEVCNHKVVEFGEWCAEVGLDEKQHQLRGVKWCLYHEMVNKPHAKVRGGIIADEMGLGKTILMLGCIRVNFKKNTLVILPPALLNQWVAIFERFLGHTPYVFRGAKGKICKEDLERQPIVVTTYGMLRVRTKKDKVTGMRYSVENVLHKIQWGRVIYDEAHHVRNMRTSTFQGAEKISSHITWMVTGTPVNNKITDLYALCKIIGLADVFANDKEQIKKVLGIHLLRRTKIDIGIQLPPVNDFRVDVDWQTQEEEDMAADIHSTLHFTNVSRDNVNGVISMLSEHHLPALIRARQMCIYPHLLQTAVRKLKRAGIVPEDLNLSKINSYSKVDAIVEKIVENKNSGKRKLVFSHFRGEIDVLKERMMQKGISCQCIDGRTKTTEKKHALLPMTDMQNMRLVCKQWNNMPEHLMQNIVGYMYPEVMIMQIQTACEGLNMQHFQEIYFTSPHWNPAVEDQAIARAHRIGQNKAVDVYRFTMRGFGRHSISFEEYCYNVQNKKREIMKIIEINRNSKVVDNDEVSEEERR